MKLATVHNQRLAAGALALLVLACTVVTAVAQPAPPYPPTPPPRHAPPPPAPYPVVAPPPPLSPTMRVLYAPFYAAGLVVRYGAYYLFVAPLEVFARALNYGAEGGVPPPERNGQTTTKPEGDAS